MNTASAAWQSAEWIHPGHTVTSAVALSHSRVEHHSQRRHQRVVVPCGSPIPIIITIVGDHALWCLRCFAQEELGLPQLRISPVLRLRWKPSVGGAEAATTAQPAQTRCVSAGPFDEHVSTVTTTHIKRYFLMVPSAESWRERTGGW
jgi:hypothetical protein